jgi:hypothetical protein
MAMALGSRPVSNVISTRPVGSPPPPPRRRLRLRLPAVAAALGLFATLWSTMVGKTVPELLKSDEREIASFRDRVNAGCVHAARDFGFFGTIPVTGSKYRILLTLDRGTRTLLVRTRRGPEFPSAEQLPRLTASFAVLQPPAQLASNYREFVAGWKALTLAVDRATSTPIRPAVGSGFSFPDPRDYQRRTRPIRQATDRIRAASIPLGLDQCRALRDRS